MTKLQPDARGFNQYKHNEWFIAQRERPEGILYCVWKPEAKDDDECVWMTETLKEAGEYIDDEIRREILERYHE